VGFAYVQNHGVDMAKVNRVQELSKEFFNLPPEIKDKYKKVNQVKCYHGYAGPGDELLNETQKNSTDLKEFSTSGASSSMTMRIFHPRSPPTGLLLMSYAQIVTIWSRRCCDAWAYF